MSRIKHPRFQPGRTKALGIEFTDGYAEVDLSHKPILSAALVQHGFEISVTPDTGGQFVVVLDADLDGTGDNLPECFEGDGEKIAVTRRSKSKRSTITGKLNLNGGLTVSGS